MLPETCPSNWRFDLGFFDKISLIYGIRHQATISHLSHQKHSFPGGECSNELLYSKKAIMYFFRCTSFLASKIVSIQVVWWQIQYTHPPDLVLIYSEIKYIFIKMSPPPILHLGWSSQSSSGKRTISCLQLMLISRVGVLENYAGYFLKEADLGPWDLMLHLSIWWWHTFFLIIQILSQVCPGGLLPYWGPEAFVIVEDVDDPPVWAEAPGLVGGPPTLTWSLPGLGRVRRVSGHLVQVPYPWDRVQILKCAEDPWGGLRQNFPGNSTFFGGGALGEPE